MADLPSGTVTFLFTDIEGSTRLLHELGDRYADALAEHRRALREAFRSHGGVEVDTQGDAFFYAFARSSDALAAAESGQRALEGGPVRVRMGLHTGEPAVTDEGYVGADVHLAARVMGAGRGGQILVSEATARLVDGDLRDLGEHRLQDIEWPVRLFQLGDGRFPPLKTLNNSNLPLPQTPLLGRKKELADVLRLLRVERARMVTVTGPGGIGKTRFALEAAHELVEDFSHGVWFVDLSALRDPALVVPTVAATLGARGELIDHVADKELLLVLDNFEQVVEAAPDVADLLRRRPNVQLLVTSREPLHVAGEREYALRPLAESPAVQLFRERAEAADPDFDAPWEALTEIVDRLDRLPLALELAAARVKVLGAQGLRDRLEQRLPLLATRARDLPSRQRALQATIEWSYELLDADEKRVFAALSVFAGGCTLEAAEQVCEADLDTLESLVDKSLLRRDGGRISMLETIREYARDRLVSSPARSDVTRRHIRHFVAFAETTYAQLVGPGRAEAVAVRETERNNLRVALEEAMAEADRGTALRLAVAIGGGASLPAAEWWQWVEAALRLPGEVSPSLLALAVRRAGFTAYHAENPERAAEMLSRAADLYRQLGDPASTADVLAGLSGLAQEQGDLGRARALLDEALILMPENAERWIRAELVLQRVDLALAEGARDEAKGLLDDFVAEARLAGTASELALGVCRLADVERVQHRIERAESLYREALELGRAGRARSVIHSCLAGLAALSALRGDAYKAGRFWGALETHEREIGRFSPGERARAEEEIAPVKGQDTFEEGRRAVVDLAPADAAQAALSIDSP